MPENKIEMDSQDKEEKFLKELMGLLNRYSVENASDTPDFILANYLRNCLIVWEAAIAQRGGWYGRGKVRTQDLKGKEICNVE